MYRRLKQGFSNISGRASPSRGSCSGTDHVPDFEPHRHIRLLTFNIQVGINTASYHHYVTRSWQHVLPHREPYRKP